MKNKSLIHKKLNSEKGVTGVDIVVAITIIILTISVVISIFININNTARKVTRTSGATRTVVNILEQIEAMYYDELLEYLEEMSTKSYVTYKSTYELTGSYDQENNGRYVVVGKNVPATEKIFNTRIPDGYTLTLDVANIYGVTDTSKFDLVKKVYVCIEFAVNGKNEKVALTTTKTFEKLVSPANMPEIVQDYFPIKPIEFNDVEYAFLKEVNVGAKTKYQVLKQMDGNYFNYSEGSVKPALMIPLEVWSDIAKDYVTTLEPTNVYVDENYIDNIYVWIPAYNIKDEKFVYGYKNSEKATKKVYLTEFNNIANKIVCYTVDRNTTEFDYKLDPLALGQAGLWVTNEELNNATEDSNEYYYNFWQRVNCSLKK